MINLALINYKKRENCRLLSWFDKC